MPKLTDLEVRNYKGPGRIGDGNGLFYEVTSTAIKRWLYRYKIDGRSGKFTIGRYPEISLKKAREAHVQARQLVRQGLNPAKARRAEKQKNIVEEREQRESKSKTFEYVALEWIKQQRGAWSKDHADAVLQTLNNDVFKAIGENPVDSIAPPEVLKILRKIENRGSLEIARKVLQRMNAVFRYAIQTGRCTYNPAADMQGVLKSKPVEHLPHNFPALLITASACLDKGTICPRLIFILSGGMCHSFCSKSISPQSAPLTSPDLHAVRAKN